MRELAMCSKRWICLVGGAIAGAALGLAGCWICRELPYRDYVLWAVIGAIVVPFGVTLYRWFTQTGHTLRVESFKVTLPVIGETNIVLSDEHRVVGWKLFVESLTRIATQPLGPRDGVLREAMTSLHGLFQFARNELKSMRPSPPPADPKDFTVELYAVLMLNQGLRPFLARWHPRLKAWEDAKLPESQWPLAPLCRADLNATRIRMLAFICGLGRMLRISHLDKLLVQVPPQTLPELTPQDELYKQEQSLGQYRVDVWSIAGWNIFIELTSRISTQPLQPGTGAISAALKSLYGLYEIIRKELKSTASPSLSSSEPNPTPDTVESIALRILNGPMRQLLAKWHPIVAAHEQANLPEANWPDQQATECRQELEAVRQSILTDTRQLGQLLGVPQLNQILPQ